VPIARPRIRFSVLGTAAGLGALVFASYPVGATAVVAGSVAAVLVVIAAIDIATLRIPNRLVLPATAFVLVANVAADPARASEFVLAALLAGTALLIPNLLNSSWMGMGDVKLAILLGAALGWRVVGALELALLAVFPVALAVRVRGGHQARRAALPFGPFMAFGALVVLIAPRLAGIGG
jgi:leader peptidase (prepilin peptidase) / N-methyltransferase